MRVLLFLALLLLPGCARINRLDGTYLSPQQDALVVNGRESLMENHASYFERDLRFRQHQHQLTFRDVSYRRIGFLRLPRSTRYRFRILGNSDDSLLLSPASRAARRYFQGRDSIVFKPRYAYADRQATFTKIIFHSGRCFGYCHDLHLELDASGNLKVTDNGHGRPGMPGMQLNNNYRAKLSSGDLERLHTILRTAQLTTLQWPVTRRCFDAPDLTLIIYRNDQCTYLRINAPCEPIVSRPLTRFLYGLFHYPDLQAVDSTFVYER
ncbi:MAG: hypothetical protein EOP50_06090 [Sphingobacteriales bacterium]|nr:MAG: hypothetical protein EOP50_06090 [Sphingobacteriales bacterium]